MIWVDFKTSVTHPNDDRIPKVIFAWPGEDFEGTTERKNRLLGKVGELSLSKSERGYKEAGKRRRKSTSEIMKLEGKSRGRNRERK